MEMRIQQYEIKHLLGRKPSEVASPVHEKFNRLPFIQIFQVDHLLGLNLHEDLFQNNWWCEDKGRRAAIFYLLHQLEEANLFFLPNLLNIFKHKEELGLLPLSAAFSLLTLICS